MNVPAHQHCEICQKVVDVETRFCSESCQARYDEAQKMKKRSLLQIVLLVVAMSLLFRFVL